MCVDGESLLFQGGGYARYTLTPSSSTGRLSRRQTVLPTRSTLSETLSLEFRTSLDHQGVLFRSGGLLDDTDFSLVQLQAGGQLSLLLDLGAGEQRLDFPQKPGGVHDAEWHRLEVERMGLDVRLMLDNMTLTHCLEGSQVYLDVPYDQHYAGGPPRQGEGHYVGCLQDIRLDGNVLPTSDSNSFASVSFLGNGSVGSGCGLRGCLPDPCQGGLCEERGEEDFVCRCEDGRRLVSEPCNGQPTVPYLFVIVGVAVVAGLALLLVLVVIGEQRIHNGLYMEPVLTAT